MTLRLHCVRCGYLADLDPLATEPGVCDACLLKWDEWKGRGLAYPKRWAMWMKWQKNLLLHPTYKALSAALDAMESTEPGTLAEASCS